MRGHPPCSPPKWENGEIDHQTFPFSAPPHQICQSSDVLVQFTIFCKFSFMNVRTYGKDPVNGGKLMLPSGGFFIFTTPFTAKQIKSSKIFHVFVHPLCQRKFSLVCT